MNNKNNVKSKNPRLVDVLGMSRGMQFTVSGRAWVVVSRRSGRVGVRPLDISVKGIARDANLRIERNSEGNVVLGFPFSGDVRFYGNDVSFAKAVRKLCRSRADNLSNTCAALWDPELAAASMGLIARHSGGVISAPVAFPAIRKCPRCKTAAEMVLRREWSPTDDGKSWDAPLMAESMLCTKCGDYLYEGR